MNRIARMGRWAAVTALLAALPREVEAQSLTISGDPFSLVVWEASAGAVPLPVTESSTVYSVVATAESSTIRARLTASLPAGVELRITLEARAGATSAGEVTLTTLDQELVHSIPSGTHTGLSITYRLTATLGAGVIAPSSRTAVLTLTEGP